MVTAALLPMRRAWASDDSVRIACPSLNPEQAAEIESRVRANLFTTSLEATVAITCRASGAEVRAARRTDDALVTTATSPTTERDDMLRAVEQALYDLTRREARAHEPPAPAPPAAIGETPASPALVPLTSAEALPPRRSAAKAYRLPVALARPLARTRSERRRLEICLALLGEAWGNGSAWGGTVGLAHGTSSFWFGVRAGVLRPAVQAQQFSSAEADVGAEIGFQPPHVAGFRLTLGLGPSMLLVVPQADLTSKTGTAKTSLFVAAHISRPIWLGRVALLPDIGGRLFAAERGVSIDGRRQRVLAGFAPQLSLGVAYGLD